MIVIRGGRGVIQGQRVEEGVEKQHKQPHEISHMDSGRVLYFFGADDSKTMQELSDSEYNCSDKNHFRVSTNILAFLSCILAPYFLSAPPLVYVLSVGVDYDSQDSQTKPPPHLLVHRFSKDEVVPQSGENRGRGVHGYTDRQRKIELGPCIKKTLQSHDAVPGELPFEVMIRAESQISFETSAFQSRQQIRQNCSCQPSDQTCGYGMEFLLSRVDKAQCDQGRTQSHHKNCLNLSVLGQSRYKGWRIPFFCQERRLNLSDCLQMLLLRQSPFVFRRRIGRPC